MTDESNQAKPRSTTIGKTLRDARNASMFSLDHVASQTHLPREVIEHLEEERFEKLPGSVFVRGYIRAYAKLLGIDAQPLIDEYNETQFDEPDITPSLNLTRTKSHGIGMDRITLWSTVAVVVVLLSLLTSWWVYREVDTPVQLAEVTQEVTQDDPQEANADVSNNELADNKSIANQTDVNAQRKHAVGLGTLSADNQSVVKETNEPEVVEPEVATRKIKKVVQTVPAIVEPLDPTAVADGKVSLTIKFLEESWIEIFDARKRRLLHGLIKPGATRVVSGQAPFNIFFGNSPGVELQINGKLFDHQRFARRNKTARFSIDDADIVGLNRVN